MTDARQTRFQPHRAGRRQAAGGLSKRVGLHGGSTRLMMDRDVSDIAETEAYRVNPEDMSEKDLMLMVLGEVRVTHQLVEAVVRLLVPQETRSEGPTLEQLITAMLGQNRTIIGRVVDIQRTLVLHEELIPANTVTALRAATAAGNRS